MYRFEVVEKSLRLDALTEALFKLEQFAISQGNTTLARWAETELRGYKKKPEPFPDYRMVVVQLVDKSGKKVLSERLTQKISPYSLTFGVQLLESRVQSGLTITLPNQLRRLAINMGLDTRAHGLSLSAGRVEEVLTAIRYEARRKLREAVPNPSSQRPYQPPNFTSIVADTKLADILKYRWQEANQNYRAKSYLSTVVILGSILEGVLLAKVQQNLRDANTAKSAPKDRSTGQVKHLREWTLETLIAVAHDCGWLGKEVKDFSSALRDYRNLIHPNKQHRDNIPNPDEATCRVSWEVVRAAIEDVAKD